MVPGSCGVSKFVCVLDISKGLRKNGSSRLGDQWLYEVLAKDLMD